MKDLWMQDIMTQKFLDSDATRIIMLYAITNKGIKKIYKKIEILEFIYRTYSDNKELANINPDIKIRNIHRYGLLDIKGILNNAIEEWKSYAQNGVLNSDERYIYLNICEEDLNSLTLYTKRLCKMLEKKYFDIEITPPKDVSIVECRNDSDLNSFGKSLYRNRVFEDVQYCPLCEETHIENLYVVHILPEEFCEDFEVIDKNNGLIMCKQHAIDYLQKKFLFNELGFVENIKSNIVDERMHLSLEIKNKERRNYIRRYYEEMDNKKS